MIRSERGLALGPRLGPPHSWRRRRRPLNRSKRGCAWRVPGPLHTGDGEPTPFIRSEVWDRAFPAPETVSGLQKKRPATAESKSAVPGPPAVTADRSASDMLRLPRIRSEAWAYP